MDFFSRHLRVNRSGALLMLGVQFALFLFGVLLVLVINRFINEDHDFAAIGSLMALMGSIFGGLMRGQGAPVRCRLAVSMGRTRRSYILTDPVITALNCLVGIGFAWALSRIELALYHALYPGWTCDLDLDVVFQWWVILLIVAGVCFLDFCLGALQLRFGAKGFAAVWFPLCFAPMIVGQAARAVQEGHDNLLAQLGRAALFVAGLLPPAAWAVIGVLLLLAILALSVQCYRRVEVRM